VRRSADQLDPPDLHRRIGQRRVRRREPAVLTEHDDPQLGGRIQSERAARLLELLGLSEDELCVLLDVDPLSLLSGQLDHRPELAILLDLLDEAAEQAGPPVLRRWVRASGRAGRPIDALTRRDFGAFEDALAELADRGFVLRSGG
jgi:hypothetical protein